MDVTDGAGVEFPLAEGDGLVVEMEVPRLQRAPSGFLPVFELGGIETGRQGMTPGDLLPLTE